MAIEIDSNTIIKLIVRNGSDEERQGIVLAEGELGYTVDTKRLFVGDGVTPGGVSVSNRFLGSTTNILDPSLSPNINDIVFKSDTNELFRLQSAGGTSLSDWQLLSGPTLNVVDNATLSANSTTGELFVNLISGTNLDDSIFSSNIVRSGNSIALAEDLAVNLVRTDAITANAAAFLNITNNIEFSDGTNTEQYVFPVNQPYGDNYHLVTDTSGNLSWAAADRVVEGTTYINTAAIPVGTITPYISLNPQASATTIAGWLFCDGSILAGSEYPELSAALGNTFGGDGITTFHLPDLNRSTTYGIDPTTESIGNSFLPTTSSTHLSPSLSAFNVYYIIKYRPDTAFEDNVLELNVQTLTSQGVSGYDITSGQSVSSVGPSGQFSISIPTGDIGTGNERVVESVQRARVPSMTAWDSPGTYEYIVPSNVYRIKVTATGAGGVGYVRWTVGGQTIWKSDGTNGGAGGSVVAYINVEPGQTYQAVIGNKGVSSNNTRTGATLGVGENTTFGLSTGGTVYDDIIAQGAYDGGNQRSLAINRVYPSYARGGYKGGGYTVNNSSGTISSYTGINGGEGGNYFGFEGGFSVGASSMWGSGPAPGGGGSGNSNYGHKGGAPRTSAAAGDGFIMVEEL